MAVVWIPPLLQEVTGGAERVTVSGATLRRVIQGLEGMHPGLKGKLVDGSGRIHSNIAVAIDGETTHLGLIEPVGENAEIHFISAIGGG